MTKTRVYLAIIMSLLLMLGADALAGETADTVGEWPTLENWTRGVQARTTEAPEETAEAPVVEPTAAPVEAPAAEPTKAPVEAPENVGVTHTVSGSAALREEPYGLSAIITTLADGAQVTVLSVEGDWAEVSVDGLNGYIYIYDLNGFERPETQEMKVTIFSSRTTVMAPGQEVVLTSVLEGFEGYTVVYQWEYDRGSGFEPVPDGDQATYVFEASVEMLAYDWRLTVYAYPIADQG